MTVEFCKTENFLMMKNIRYRDTNNVSPYYTLTTQLDARVNDLETEIGIVDVHYGFTNE